MYVPIPIGALLPLSGSRSYGGWEDPVGTVPAQQRIQQSRRPYVMYIYDYTDGRGTSESGREGGGRGEGLLNSGRGREVLKFQDKRRGGIDRDGETVPARPSVFTAVGLHMVGACVPITKQASSSSSGVSTVFCVGGQDRHGKGGAAGLILHK